MEDREENESSLKPTTDSIATWRKYIESAKDEADLRQRLYELGVAIGKARYPMDPDAYFVEVPELAGGRTDIDCWACGGVNTRLPWPKSTRAIDVCLICNGYGFLFGEIGVVEL